MKTTSFEVQKKENGTWVSRYIDGTYHCALIDRDYFSSAGGYNVYHDGLITRYPSYEAAIEGAKSQIITEDGTLHLEVVDNKIDAMVNDMNTSLSQRIARLRGKLFGQMCKLQSAIKL